MIKNTQKINNYLSEQILQEARTIFTKHSPNLTPLPLNKLPQLLHHLNIQIPQTMLKDYFRWLSILPISMLSFNQFTNLVMRSILQDEIQQQIRTLFYNIDRGNNGSLDAEDLFAFIKELDGGQIFSEEDVDQLVREIDQMKVGYVTYEDLVYALLPK